MKHRYKTPDKGDPSDIIQSFPQYHLNILCCRYWWIENWEFKELAYPYWRIYHNNHQGGTLYSNNETYELTPDKILLIAPNTSYATRLYDHEIPDIGYAFKGGRVSEGLSNKKQDLKNLVLHLFIHFNIGMPYDHVKPGVFVFHIDKHLDERLNIIKRHLNYEHSQFSLNTSLAIQSLIHDLLLELPKEYWTYSNKDERILNTLAYIETHLTEDLSNPILGEQAKMATNAFSRLFVDELDIPPQKYVKQKRVDSACILLHHSNYTIEQVAFQTGFADRYHFSRVFKQITGISPAKYKKEFTIE